MSSPKPAQTHQNRACISIDHPSCATTATFNVLHCTRAFIVDSVYYTNPTGLAEDTTNTFAGVVKKGSTTFATLFDTDSDNPGTNTLPAGTWVAGVLDADSTKYAFEPGDDLVLVFTEGGNSTLPAGRLVCEVRYV